jgi:hypothetical protein
MARKLKVDFTDVDTYVRCEEGEHVAVLKELNEAEAKETGNDMLVAKFEVVKGESKGAVVYNNFVLTEKSLWRLKTFLESVGVKADGRVQIDLDKIVGKKVIVVVAHEDYNGQPRARIEGFKPLVGGKVVEPDDEDEEDEEEETPVKPKKQAATSKKKKPPVDEDEDEEEDDEDEAPRRKTKTKPSKAKKKPPVDEDEDDDWEEED